MNTLSLSYQGKSIAVTDGKYGRATRDHLKALGLKGKARRMAYYEILDNQRHEVTAVNAEFDRRGFKTEITRVATDKAGEVSAVYYKQFRPAKAGQTKDARIAELERKLAEIQGARQ